MKKLGKKIKNLEETLESYACTSCPCGCICSCFLAPNLSSANHSISWFGQYDGAHDALSS
jgi:putative bacteriocin precursor